MQYFGRQYRSLVLYAFWDAQPVQCRQRISHRAFVGGRCTCICFNVLDACTVRRLFFSIRFSRVIVANVLLRCMRHSVQMNLNLVHMLLRVTTAVIISDSCCAAINTSYCRAVIFVFNLLCSFYGVQCQIRAAAPAGGVSNICIPLMHLHRRTL